VYAKKYFGRQLRQKDEKDLISGANVIKTLYGRELQIVVIS
jgi:hypothetical protein